MIDYNWRFFLKTRVVDSTALEIGDVPVDDEGPKNFQPQLIVGEESNWEVGIGNLTRTTTRGTSG